MHSLVGADYGELLLEAKEVDDIHRAYARGTAAGRQPCLRAGDGYRRTDTRLC